MTAATIAGMAGWRVKRYDPSDGPMMKAMVAEACRWLITSVRAAFSISRSVMSAVETVMVCFRIPTSRRDKISSHQYRAIPTCATETNAQKGRAVATSAHSSFERGHQPTG
jgi:hypothetical protein